jgi:hypothetical protein
LETQYVLNNKIFKRALAEIIALGFSVSDHYTPGSVAYNIISGRSNARWWLVPLTNRRVAVNGLSMFQPMIRSSKLFKCFAVVTGSVGLASLWTRKKIYISGTTQLGDVFGEKDLHYAFFTGTDSPHRKVSVQIMGRDGTIKGFAKVSSNSAVKPLLAHEADTLNHVNTLDLQTALIPKVLFNGEMGGAGVLITDTLKTCRAKTVTTLTDAHVAFLHELCDKTAVPGTADTNWVVTEMRCQYDAVVDRLPVIWQARLTQAIACMERYEGGWGARSLNHGDFTPWNTFFVEDKLYVFDWEYASKEFSFGYDLSHMLHSLEKLDSSNDVTTALNKMIESIRKFKSPLASVETQFLAYLVSYFLFYLSREPKPVVNYLSCEEVLNIEKMIDVLSNETNLLSNSCSIE